MNGASVTDLDTIVSLCKRRGFIFQSSEIYGGLGSAWDYGPLGVEMKRNVKHLWWRDNVHRRHDMVGLDAAITMHPKVWEASGHTSNFADPFTGCTDCNRYYRADQIGETLKSSKWVQAVKKLLEGPAGQKDPEKALRNWATNDGKKLAPNHPGVKNPDQSATLRDPGPGVCPTAASCLEPSPRTSCPTTLGPVEATGTQVSSARDGTGHLREHDNILNRREEAAVRRRTDRQGVPERDHARQLHVPHARVRADGDRVLLPPGHGREDPPGVDRRAPPLVLGVRDPEGEPQAPRAREGRARVLRQALRRRRVPVPDGLERARGDREPHGLRPEAALEVQRKQRRTSTRKRRSTSRRTSSSPPPAPTGRCSRSSSTRTTRRT